MRRMVLAALLLALPLAVPAHAGTLQPGAMIVTAGGECTGNFVFDGTGPMYGRVFIGTAAHCTTQVGEAAFEGYDRYGASTSIDLPEIGTVVARGTPDPPAEDWALIEISPARIKDVSPQLKGHPDLPRGTELRDPAALKAGDPVQFSGYAQGFDATQPTREERVGIYSGWREDGAIELFGPASFGDSGGPIVHLPTGRPLSLHSLFAGVQTVPISTLVDRAAAAGYPVATRTLDSPPVPRPATPAPAPAATPQPAAQPAREPAAKPKPAAKKKKKRKPRKKKRRAKPRRR